MIRFLPTSVILAIHDDLIRLYGGSYGLRDQGMFESAIAQPQARFSFFFLHRTIFQMAAAYAFHLSKNHPFIDGNKRVAGMVMFTFLQLNNLTPTADEDEYYKKMMALASGELDKAQLADWLQTVVEGPIPQVEP
jgi:death-on-curing protein